MDVQMIHEINIGSKYNFIYAIPDKIYEIYYLINK